MSWDRFGTNPTALTLHTLPLFDLVTGSPPDRSTGARMFQDSFSEDG